MKRLLCAFLMLALLLSSVCASSLAEETFSIPTTVAAGDIVTMGSYEQDNNLENGAEPIEWIVLETNGESAFLLSKYCLETKIVYHMRVACYWGRSDLRTWMNGEFYEQIFTDAEKEKIQTTAVKNQNRHGLKGGGEDTMDKLYLLSKKEVMSYYPTMAERVAYPTAYCIAQGCTVGEKNGAARWWLRDQGARSCDMCGVRVDGRISAYGMQDMDWKGNTIRPVMWVTLGE